MHMVEHVQQDYLFRGNLEELDPEVAELVRHETARQARTVIMIPSESTIPEAVREAVGSAFQNIYAEGYPLESMRHMDERDILDYSQRLPEYRRNADNRYYKGTEYANLIESLARRRAAQVFANERVSADQLFVNVQPLSGAPANNAVYTALIKPGDTILSMDLVAGGHLSHGSPVNRSGKQYNIVSYAVDSESELLDYDRILELAKEHQPKIIIGGYSSYPMAPDWEAYRRVADEVGAYLLADVAHFAGMVAAGVYPSPVGIADIVTFTTHKTLNGPRGAVIVTHRKDLAAKLDRGVFPGEQGGPHVNSIAGLAVALRFAMTEQFQQLQQRTADNAKRLAQRLEERGLRIPHGGSDSHMLVVDLKTVRGEDGTPLSGDMAARILDLVGVVCNRQTIPGDTSALRPSGIRLGTPWITQRGAGFTEIDELGDIIADVLLACKPFRYTGKDGARAKINFDTLHNARLALRNLIDRLGIDTDVEADPYPHFAYIDDSYNAAGQTFAVRGKKAQEFLNIALTSDVLALTPGNQQPTHILEADGTRMASGWLEMVSETDYRLHLSDNPARTAAWLRSLSDGFVIFDPEDLYAKVPGPVDIAYIGETEKNLKVPGENEGIASKTTFIGMRGLQTNAPELPAFEYEESTQPELLKSALWDAHNHLNAKMGEFAGYEMPLWYESVQSEHLAVRKGAGIFDVTHMGVWDVQGADAEAFLHALTTNDVQRLKVGSSHYTFLLDENGIPFDDLLIYRLGKNHFFLVVNASNNNKNWAWVNAVKDGTVRVDANMPQRRIVTPNVTIRDLRAKSSGADRRVDIALQGPHSKNVLLEMQASEEDLAKLNSLKWAGITRVRLDGFDLLISRTGYTGERIAYELFPHPDDALALFRRLVELGAVPCGLAARDSLRIEAGLPLYGHELAGDLNLNPADAGMGSYVKLYKPFFIGKAAFAAHEATRDAEVTRFRMDQKRARPAHAGDPIIDSRGRVVGIVTSCSIDSEGYQLGQVYLKNEYRKRGTQLGVYAGSARCRWETAHRCRSRSPS
jgi:glycine hydroxymethyltransferase